MSQIINHIIILVTFENMCGIFAIFGSKGSSLVIRHHAIKLSKKIRHRGPDSNGIEIIVTFSYI